MNKIKYSYIDISLSNYVSKYAQKDFEARKMKYSVLQH